MDDATPATAPVRRWVLPVCLVAVLAVFVALPLVFGFSAGPGAECPAGATPLTNSACIP